MPAQFPGGRHPAYPPGKRQRRKGPAMPPRRATPNIGYSAPAPASSSPAAALVRATGKVLSAAVSVTPLSTLMAGKADNSYTLLTVSGEITSMANGLPRTLDDFDPGGHTAPVTWTSDSAVNQTVMAGVSTINTPSMWAFGACGIAYDGYSLYMGGGHDGSGDGTFYELDAQLAAANINGGGSGIPWGVKVPSGRYLDAFTNVQPAWSSQPTITPTPTALNQSYYITTNKNGRNMPAVGHAYHGTKAMPGTRIFLFSSFGVFDASGQPSLGAPWNYDATNDILIGPLTVTDNTTGFGPDVVYGYAQANNAEGGPTPVCISPSDSTVYSIAGNSSPAFGNFVVKYTDPLTSSIAQTVAPNPTTPVFDQNSYSFVRTDGVIIPDPADPLDEVMFIHGVSTTGYDDTKFLLATGLKGHATPAFVVGTYATGSVTTNGKEFISPCYDTKRGIIVFTDGDHLYTVTPNASISGWTIAAVTGSTGDTPPAPSTLQPANATSVVPAVAYLPNDDVYLHVQFAEVRAYRPPGWSPPTGASGVVPVASLTATPAGSSTNVTAQGSSSPTAAALRSTGKPLNGAASAVAALLRRIGKPPAANSNAVASLVRQDGKPVSASGVAASTSVRSTSKPLVGSSSPVATAATIKTKLQSALAVATAVAALLRQTSKAASGNQAPTASLTRSASKPEQGSSAPIAIASTIRVKLQGALASTAPVATLARQTGKLALALASAAAVLSRQISKAAQSIVAAAATLARQTGKPSKASALAIGSLTAIKVHVVAALAAAISVASLVRRTGKLAPSSAAQQATLRRVTAKSIAAAIAALASFSTGRRFALAFQAVAAAIASALTAFLSSLTANLARLVGLGRRPRRSVGLDAAAKRTVGRGEKPKRTV